MVYVSIKIISMAFVLLSTFTTGYVTCPHHTIEQHLHQWTMARAAVGMVDKRLSEYEKGLISIFYSFSSGVGLYNTTIQPTTYVNIYKCGSSVIRANLRRQSLHRRNHALNGHPTFHENTTAYLSYLHEYSIKPFVFTFVREPISHFEAGMREYLLRCGELCRTTNSANISASELKREINNLLDLNIKSLSNAPHVYSMSGALRAEYNVSYVGKLENFTTDWGVVAAAAGFENKFNSSIINHPSSGWISAKHAFNNALTDERYVRALCWLLYDDYYCFNYTLPSPCSHLTPEVVYGSRKNYSIHNGHAYRSYRHTNLRERLKRRKSSQPTVL
mmetsp:Transcript_15817/g.23800  ORF Transcript_15817/g.23800 Transcript_15817/m.23800 type:complete len:332 (-) Transcript_15817:150-1145(-)